MAIHDTLVECHALWIEEDELHDIEYQLYIIIVILVLGPTYLVEINNPYRGTPSLMWQKTHLSQWYHKTKNRFKLLTKVHEPPIGDDLREFLFLYVL